MQFGLFLMPSHPPERSYYDGHQWDLQTLRWADQYGFREAWIGEHHTCVWEPNPSPDLLIAQALMQTEHIRLGPGGFILPYHHPAELAFRIAFLDHISRGRLNFGVATGALPSDWAVFNSGNRINRDMTQEALQIILKMWAEKTFEFKGQYWTVNKPPPQGTPDNTFFAHLTPLQKPHPPIAMAGAFSIRSESLVRCGEFGYLPLSLNMASHFTARHWASVEEGAARSGRQPTRAEWRIVRDVLVAETDELAWEYAVKGEIGRMFREYFLPLMKGIKTDRIAAEYFAHVEGLPLSEITTEYCAHHNWLIGSPSTVARKIERMYEEVGGFGTLVLHGFDYADHPEIWRRSLQLLAQEVGPMIAHLTGEKPSVARQRAAAG